MDSMCILIGLQVCFHSAMKHENGVSNVADCLRAVRIKALKYTLRISFYSSLRFKIIIL